MLVACIGSINGVSEGYWERRLSLTVQMAAR